jgi:hypothetical protein
MGGWCSWRRPRRLCVVAGCSKVGLRLYDSAGSDQCNSCFAASPNLFRKMPRGFMFFIVMNDE